MSEGKQVPPNVEVDIKLISFWDDVKQARLKEIKNLVAQGYEIEHYDSSLTGSTVHHSFVLMIGHLETSEPVYAGDGAPEDTETE